MMRWQNWAAVAVAVLAAGSTMAQGQRQPGGRGGFGQPQPLHMLVLTNEDLQKDLKVTDDQKKSLKDVTDKAAALAKKRQDAFSGGQFDREKMQEIQKESETLTADAKPVVEKALTDDQKKRMKQIDVQRKGLNAFTDEEVVKELKLTDDQKAKLKTVSDDYRKASTDLRTEYGLGGRGGGQGERPSAEKMAEYQKKATALTTETMDKAKKELTDDQKKAWADLTGAAFDLTKLQPARPMRRDN